MKTPPDFARILSGAERMWRNAPALAVNSGAPNPAETNLIITADNLAASRYLLDTISPGGGIRPRLVYMDPPFYTKMDYAAKMPDGRETAAFSDAVNQSFEDYLTDIAARICAAHELLAADGALWLHLDHHAVHYAKLLADCIFGGPKHLINEVIWQYKSGGATKKRFSRKHDTLLFYAKNPNRYTFFPLTEKSYNRGKRRYGFKGVNEYRDDEGWFTVVNMKDVWRIDMVGRTSRERTGYATQKPVALLERIIASCSGAGELCVDFFGGAGTLAAAAEGLGRRWISIDQNPLAGELTAQRLTEQGATFGEIRG
ncbi:MAG: site-specific DNA-methyltransferase [Clostridiales Family XIII bacterium]|jgi:DNA modification methylase|nr:site-specific DNA-methyltransferase [Clostridiales Family XIII bacterium]